MISGNVSDYSTLRLRMAAAMISRSELPEDAADWSSVAISFPRLSKDDPHSCPCSIDEVFAYVKAESGDRERTDRRRLTFVRTAQVADARYWLWSYKETDGEVAYVTCRVEVDDSMELGLAKANGLNAEQFLLAEYYDEVYWA